MMGQSETCLHGHVWNIENGSRTACPICAGGIEKTLCEAESVALDDLPPAPRHDSSIVIQPWPNVVGYELVEEIGRGGMGVVYKATQLSLRRTVALKVLAPGLRTDVEALARFRAEAETIAHTQHPNIVQIYDVMEHNGLLCFAMEFVEGGNLKDRIARGPIPADRAAEMVRTLAWAVQAAHERGIIHRDLKPANILVSIAGAPKITDFGLAKRLDQSADQTRSGCILGTPQYMAPEQAEGGAKHAGPLIDIYALGVILYEMLTGKPPFHGDSTAHVLKQVLFDEPIPPSRLRRDIPAILEGVCMKCLTKDATKRFPTAGALAAGLDRFLESKATTAAEDRHEVKRRRSWKWVPIGLLLAVGLVSAPFLSPVRNWFSRPESIPAHAPSIQLHWEILTSPATQKDEVFDRIAFPTRQTGYLASRLGLYKTDDAGNTWKRLPLDALGRVHALHFTDAMRGWLGTDRLRETRDGGATWQDVKLGTEPLRAVTALAIKPDGLNLTGGTTVSGKLALFCKPFLADKWERIELNDDFKPMASWSVAALTISNSDVGFATLFQSYDGGGAVLRTKDGGKTWLKVFAHDDDLFHLLLNQDKKGWLVGFRGKQWYTEDHGSTFQPYAFPHKDGATPTCLAFDSSGSLGLAPLWKGKFLVKIGNHPWQNADVPLGFTLPHAVVVETGCAYILGADGRLARFLDRP